MAVHDEQQQVPQPQQQPQRMQNEMQEQQERLLQQQRTQMEQQQEQVQRRLQQLLQLQENMERQRTDQDQILQQLQNYMQRLQRQQMWHTYNFSSQNVFVITAAVVCGLFSLGGLIFVFVDSGRASDARQMSFFARAMIGVLMTACICLAAYIVKIQLRIVRRLSRAPDHQRVRVMRMSELQPAGTPPPSYSEVVSRVPSFANLRRPSEADRDDETRALLQNEDVSVDDGHGTSVTPRRNVPLVEQQQADDETPATNLDSKNASSANEPVSERNPVASASNDSGHGSQKNPVASTSKDPGHGSQKNPVASTSKDPGHGSPKTAAS